MFVPLNDITLDTLVSIAGVLGFVLSVILAAYQIITNWMRVSTDGIVLVDDCKESPKSVFLLFALVNKTRLPFTLTNLHIRDRVLRKDVKIETSIQTFRRLSTEDKLEVKPVVLSQVFPVRFDAYDAKLFLFEVSRQNIDTTLFHLDASAHNQTGHFGKFYFLYRLCTHRPRFRLVMHTSRGRRVVEMNLRSVEKWEYLQSYAIQRAAGEGKIIFSS